MRLVCNPKRLPMLLAASALSIAPALAQSYSPAPAVAGAPLTFTIGYPGPTSVDNFVVTIYGPSTISGPALPFGGTIVAPEVYSIRGQPVHGVFTFQTPSLAAGIYRILIDSDLLNAPTQETLGYFTVYGQDGSDNGAVQGQYTFQFQGTQNGSAAQPAFALGSLTLDGAGKVLTGVMDINSPGAVLRAVAVKGTYTFNLNGSGVLNLTAPQGSFQFPFASPVSPSTVITPVMTGIPTATYPLDPSAYLNAASIATTPASGFPGSGILQQTLTPDGNQAGNQQLILPLNGTYQATLAGGTSGASGMPVFVSGASSFTFGPGEAVTDQGTLAANGVTFSYPELTGAYTNFDAVTGRAAMVLPQGAAAGPPAEDFAVYSLAAGATFYYLSLTPRTQSAYVLSGRGTH